MIAVVPIRQLAMHAQALAHEIIIDLDLDRVDLDALDELLRSEHSPPDIMMLSELDGFLTGIAVGPELILPSEWLPLTWGGGAPEFADLNEANAILGLLTARYNEILRDITDDALAPIFCTDRNGAVTAMDWAQGFLQAISLRVDAWEPLFTSVRYGRLLIPILAPCCDKNGASLLGLPPKVRDCFAEEAPELIPSCVIGIAVYWRRKETRHGTTKVGRNDPCPCGSRRKFKRCCGHGA